MSIDYKNQLLFWARFHNFDLMNFLQENGLISDNAVSLNDIAKEDWMKCYAMLEDRSLQKFLD